MPDTPFPHVLIPPPPPFPTWQADEEGPLVYLAWGGRDYHRFPIPIHTNPGWTYWVLLQGAAEIHTVNERIPYHAGQGFYNGPDAAVGFHQQPASDVKVAVWIWKESPHCLNHPDPSRIHSVTFRQDQIALLKDLHAQTRLEIFQPQPHSIIALEHIYGLMEVQFARAQAMQVSGEHEILLHRAKQWMVEHIAEMASMQDLAHYLGISVTRLHRLFQAEFQTSPGTFFHTLRMRHCARLLKRGSYSVKRVAYENGYRHANDFSRAFKKHFGFPPSLQENRG